jgi:hypothetical protein
MCLSLNCFKTHSSILVHHLTMIYLMVFSFTLFWVFFFVCVCLSYIGLLILWFDLFILVVLAFELRA